MGDPEKWYEEATLDGWLDEDCMTHLCFMRSLGCITPPNWHREGNELNTKLKAVGITSLRHLLIDLPNIDILFEANGWKLIHHEWETLAYEATLLFERQVQAETRKVLRTSTI